MRTEPNVRLAVLFGSLARGNDQEGSDVDVLVVLADSSVGRLAGLTERLTRRVARNVQLIRLADAENAPVLLADIIDQGRVLIDREDRWADLVKAGAKWRRLARGAERILPAMDGLELDSPTV
ncbi:MAG: nucleotidyltransferase family protein [Solirubrobacteraceae bacterium]